jgi:hypothetical protein
MVSAYCRAVREQRSRKFFSLIMVIMARARSAGLSSMRIPVSPSLINSGKIPLRAAITGLPQDGLALLRKPSVSLRCDDKKTVV